MLRNLLLTILITITLFGCEKEPTLIRVSFDKSYNQIEMVEGSLSNIVSSYGPRVLLSQPAETDVTVYLTASGAATLNEDYTIRNPVIISKGSTSASLGLLFIDDKLDEFDEIATLKIANVMNIAAEIDTATTKFLIADDDAADLRVSLLWGTGGNTGSDHIAMDLYLWRELSPGSNTFEIVKKITEGGPLGYAGVVLSGLEKDGLYGLSYVYRTGNTDNFSFRVIFESQGSAILEGGMSQLEFTPTYNLINVNSGEVNIREQFFTKKGFQFKNITPLVVPLSGS